VVRKRLASRFKDREFARTIRRVVIVAVVVCVATYVLFVCLCVCVCVCVLVDFFSYEYS